MGFSKVFKDLVERKERAERGEYNCVPLPFERFRTFFPGIEKGTFLIVTANEKIGKSKFVDFLFIYELIFFAIDNPTFHFHVIYFTLEMSQRDKELEFYSHLLYRLDNIVISPSDLRSVDNTKPVPQYVLDLLESEKYQRYIKFYEEHIEYFADSSNPTGLRKVVRGYADTHGRYNHIPYEVINEVTGAKEIRMRLDPGEPYTPYDPEEYVFVVTDNAANITTESGMSEKETIDKWSKDQIVFRDQLKYIPVLIQHQAQAAQSLDNIKMDLLLPSTTNLGKTRTTANDATIILGLYSPFAFSKREYEKYDITRLKDYSRFLVVVADRCYGANGKICPLFFNGASSFWAELPRPEDTQALNAVYSYIDSLEQKRREKTFFLKIFSKFRFKRNK